MTFTNLLSRYFPESVQARSRYAHYVPDPRARTVRTITSMIKKLFNIEPALVPCPVQMKPKPKSK